MISLVLPTIQIVAAHGEDKFESESYHDHWLSIPLSMMDP